MKTHATAALAIRHSEQYGEIAMCANTQDNQDALLMICDDDCQTNGLHDYWLDDPDSDEKMLWRVNVLLHDPGMPRLPDPSMTY